MRKGFRQLVLIDGSKVAPDICGGFSLYLNQQHRHRGYQERAIVGLECGALEVMNFRVIDKSKVLKQELELAIYSYPFPVLVP